MPDPSPPPARERLLFAATVLLLAGAAVWLGSRFPGMPLDFDLQWQAGRALRAGENPYEAVGPGRAFPFPFGMYYPLPATVVTLPLSFLPLLAGRAVFILGSAALLAWAATRKGTYLLPMFVSGAFLHACLLGQWSPLLTASLLLPGLAVFAVVKPNLGAALALASGSRHYIRAAAAGALLLSVAASALHPGWLGDWLRVLASTPENSHTAPVLKLGGPILLLALLRWRDPEGRLLAGLACVPQTGLLTDTLPLFLVCRTAREGWMLAALSWVALAVQTGLVGRMLTPEIVGPDPIAAFNVYRETVATWLIWLIYMPALVIVLRRPHGEHVFIPAPPQPATV